MKSYESLLREHGIKVTPQRMGIVEELMGEIHLSVDELYERIKKRFPSISLATVYKNLNTMVESGFLSEVKIPHQKSKYELTKKPHSHLLCESCGKVEDIELDLDKVIEESIKRSGYVVHQNSLVLSGVCPSCR
jgi:Fur family peroxide stress response transcriptional regulator